MKPFQLLLGKAQMDMLVDSDEHNPQAATMDIIRKIRGAIDNSYNKDLAPGTNGIFITMDNAELVVEALDKLAERNENLAVATVALENRWARFEAVIDEVLLDVPDHVQETIIDALQEIKND